MSPAAFYWTIPQTAILSKPRIRCKLNPELNRVRLTVAPELGRAHLLIGPDDSKSVVATDSLEQLTNPYSRW